MTQSYRDCKMSASYKRNLWHFSVKAEMPILMCASNWEKPVSAGRFDEC